MRDLNLVFAIEVLLGAHWHSLNLGRLRLTWVPRGERASERNHSGYPGMERGQYRAQGAGGPAGKTVRPALTADFMESWQGYPTGSRSRFIVNSMFADCRWRQLSTSV